MTGITGRGARAVWMVAVGVLCAAQSTASAAWADAPDGGMETTHGPSPISNADSWLEIDRTLNVLAPLSKGTAGEARSSSTTPPPGSTPPNCGEGPRSP